MHLAFRKGADGVLGALVRLRTASIYSHVEIVLDHCRGQPSSCFGASWMDGGVRSKTILLAPDKWDVVAVRIPGNRMLRALKQTGKPYDYAGALFWGTAFAEDAQDKSAWFCSEICAWALGLGRPWAWSPGALFNHLTGDAHANQQHE